MSAVPAATRSGEASHHAALLLSKGNSQDQVVSALVNLGYPADVAAGLVSDARPAAILIANRRLIRNALLAAALMVAGAAMAFMTHVISIQKVMFLVSYGTLAFGAYRLIMTAYAWRTMKA